jgi:hypothetical protein
MYIPQFWCGVVATILFELALFIVFLIYCNFKYK